MTTKKQKNPIGYTNQLKLAQASFNDGDYKAAIAQAEVGLERTMSTNSSQAKKVGEQLEEIMALANEAMNEEKEAKLALAVEKANSQQPTPTNEATPGKAEQEAAYEEQLAKVARDEVKADKEATLATSSINESENASSIELTQATPDKDDSAPDNATPTPPTTTNEAPLTQMTDEDRKRHEQDKAIQEEWGFLPLSLAELREFDLFTRSKIFEKTFDISSLETWIRSYKELSVNMETPQGATNLMSAIIGLESDLREARELPPKFRDFAISGIQSEIAEKQSQLSKIPSNTAYAFKAMVLWPIAKALFSDNALKPAGKRAKGNGKTHPEDYEGALKLVKDYDDCNLPYGGKVDVSALVFGSKHPKVLAANLSIPDDKLGVFNLDGVMQGTISAQAKSGSKAVIAICYVMGVPQNDLFEESFATSGPIGWHESQHQDNGSKELLDKFQPNILKANLLVNGANKEDEAQKAGRNGDTEPELAIAK